MNVYRRFAVLLILVSSYYIVAAEQASHSERALRAALADACANGSGTSCDPDVASSADYVAGKSELLKKEDLAFLKDNFRPFEQVAKDYPDFYDWSEKAKKEKDGKIKEEILALEKDMRQATILAIELVSANAKQNLGNSLEKLLDEKKQEGAERSDKTEKSREAKASPQELPQASNSPSPQPPRTGAAPIFKPNFLQIPLLKVALTNFAKNTNFKRDLGSEDPKLSDEENVELLLGRIKDRVTRFGKRIGLEEADDYPIGRAGAPLDAADYQDFPDLKAKE
ncbi:MAG: hypothetical protein H6617_00400 [Bdellovibrionaceae bacterium]|nr:hypothetical protein [Bdellovibrionales bacterium]MCB9253128.1 hypothetical protein [Pseudobdellovibrionaceae bacterium]